MSFSLAAQLNQSAEQILARVRMKYGHVNGLKSHGRSTSRTTSAQICYLSIGSLKWLSAINFPEGRISVGNLWNDLSVGNLPEDMESAVLNVAFSIPKFCLQGITWHCSKSNQMALLSKKCWFFFFPAFILILYFIFIFIFNKSRTFFKSSTLKGSKFTLSDYFWIWIPKVQLANCSSSSLFSTLSLD